MTQRLTAAAVTPPDRLRRPGMFRPAPGETCHGLLPGQRPVPHTNLAYMADNMGAIRRDGMEVGVLMTNTPGVNGATGTMNVTIVNGGKRHDVKEYHNGTMIGGAHSAAFRTLTGTTHVRCAAAYSQNSISDICVVLRTGARGPCLCCPTGRDRRVEPAELSPNRSESAFCRVARVACFASALDIGRGRPYSSWLLTHRIRTPEE